MMDLNQTLEGGLNIEATGYTPILRSCVLTTPAEASSSVVVYSQAMLLDTNALCLECQLVGVGGAIGVVGVYLQQSADLNNWTNLDFMQIIGAEAQTHTVSNIAQPYVRVLPALVNSDTPEGPATAVMRVGIRRATL